MPCPRNQIVFQLTSPQGDELKNPREFAPEKIFQLTSPRGDEPYLHLHLLPQRQLKFQFTSPRGDELKMARVLVRVYHFNSHLREETNKNSISPQQNKKIFQLTSPRGDKPDDKFCLMPYLSFQFTSPFGDELLSSLACAKTLQFQITFPCGNERILIIWSTVPENFNSRLRNETNFEICSFR